MIRFAGPARHALTLAALALCAAPFGWHPAAAGTERISLSATTPVISRITSPEGPSYLPDGTIAAVSFMPGEVLRSVAGQPEAVDLLATLGRGISGTALLDPDHLMVARMNMGAFLAKHGGVSSDPGDAGQILVVDLRSLHVSIAFDETAGDPIKGPNDITVDAAGNAWLSDAVTGSVLYVDAGQEAVTVAASGIEGANGIALSPDGGELYLTDGGELVAYAVTGPGTLGARRVVAPLPEGAHADGIKVQADGRILTALGTAGIWRVAPDGSAGTVFDIGGQNVVNFAFGRDAAARTLYIVLNGDDGGQIVALDWDSAGL